ncbi:ATP-grasp domain-containing protein [Francisella sp. 19X1-34]|uniref:ATP-grasp domain-containing protein n=1 Tax=Francisella sp. 19X1-34 TaxID=3087177 RepID=UPI002E34E8A4|nr:ATP-grasp domain-containing protein [Francisella sp. 19X1-34]MED7788730.1 ATP-grasp domain-containing protein [Francisella sp. 19X1-34]
MHNRLSEKGLNHISQKIFNPVEENIENYLPINYPCFVKPANGSGSIGSSKISSNSEFINFFKNLPYKKIKDYLSVYSSNNESLNYLICEYIDGEEYFVDTFSYKGNHFISSIQKYTKRYVDNSPMYCFCEIVDNKYVLKIISSYMNKVLSALGLSNGFAHSELFITKKDKPVLVEVNQRLVGAHGIPSKMTSIEGKYTQLDLMISKLQNSNIDLKQTNIKTRAVTLFHYSDKPLNLPQKFDNFKSVCSIVQLKPNGYCHKNKPQSLDDLVAIILLISNDKNLIRIDTDELLKKDLKGWI